MFQGQYSPSVGAVFVFVVVVGVGCAQSAHLGLVVSLQHQVVPGCLDGFQGFSPHRHLGAKDWGVCRVRWLKTAKVGVGKYSRLMLAGFVAPSTAISTIYLGFICHILGY